MSPAGKITAQWLAYLFALVAAVVVCGSLLLWLASMWGDIVWLVFFGSWIAATVAVCAKAVYNDAKRNPMRRK